MESNHSVSNATEATLFRTLFSIVGEERVYLYSLVFLQVCAIFLGVCSIFRASILRNVGKGRKARRYRYQAVPFGGRLPAQDIVDRAQQRTDLANRIRGPNDTIVEYLDDIIVVRPCSHATSYDTFACASNDDLVSNGEPTVADRTATDETGVTERSTSGVNPGGNGSTTAAAAARVGRSTGNDGQLTVSFAPVPGAILGEDGGGNAEHAVFPRPNDQGDGCPSIPDHDPPEYANVNAYSHEGSAFRRT